MSNLSRSHLVHEARLKMPNRFELTMGAAKLARSIHIIRANSNRVPDSLNEALRMIAGHHEVTTTVTIH